MKVRITKEYLRKNTEIAETQVFIEADSMEEALKALEEADQKMRK